MDSSMAYTILVAEDDKDIAAVIKLYLENEGYEVVLAENGVLALEAAERQEINLAVLDIMMPEMNGYELIKKIREKSNMPIVVLSAKNLDSDKILGLDLGADDYLTKPFNPLELIARVKSNIRRYYSLGSQMAAGEEKRKLLTVGELTLDEDAVILKKRGEVIAITPTEYKMLSLFMKSPGKVFTKMQIYQAVNGECYVNDDNTLMVHISNLRDKIEDNPREPRYIKNIRGIGYKIEKQQEKGQKLLCASDEKLYYLYSGHGSIDGDCLLSGSAGGRKHYDDAKDGQTAGRHGASFTGEI